jgi:hypothetical protein
VACLRGVSPWFVSVRVSCSSVLTRRVAVRVASRHATEASARSEETEELLYTQRLAQACLDTPQPRQSQGETKRVCVWCVVCGVCGVGGSGSGSASGKHAPPDPSQWASGSPPLHYPSSRSPPLPYLVVALLSRTTPLFHALFSRTTPLCHAATHTLVSFMQTHRVVGWRQCEADLFAGA